MNPYMPGRIFSGYVEEIMDPEPVVKKNFR